MIKKIFNSFFWSFSSKISVVVLQLMLLYTLSRMLEASDFGVMGVLMVIVGFSKILSEFGFGSAIVQKKYVDDDDKRNVMFISVIIALVIAVIIFTFSSYIAIFLNNNNFVFFLRLISFVFVVDAVVVVQMAIAQKNMDFKYISFVSFVSFLVGNFFVAIILAYLGFGVVALIMGYISSSLINFVLYCKKYGVVMPSYKSGRISKFIHFSSYFTIGRIANYFANQGDYLVIGKVMGVDKLGYYTRAYQMMSSPVDLIGGTFQKVLFPAFSNINNDIERLKRYYIYINKVFSYISVLLGFVVFVSAEEIVGFVLGSGWEKTIVPLKIMSLSLFFKLGYKTTTPIMNALNEVKKRSYVEVIYMICVFAFVYIGSFYGLNGAALGVLISLIVNYIISNVMCLRVLRITIKDFIKELIYSFLFLLILLGGFFVVKCCHLYAVLYITIIMLFLIGFYKSGLLSTEIDKIINIKV